MIREIEGQATEYFEAWYVKNRWRYDSYFPSDRVLQSGGLTKLSFVAADRRGGSYRNQKLADEWETFQAGVNFATADLMGGEDDGE